MATTFQGKHVVKTALDPVSVTSDGATGDYIDYNGYNRVFLGFDAGLVATGDSDDTLAFQLYRIDDIAAASAAASDHVAITAGTVTLGPSADTTAELAIEFIDLDLKEHGMDNGCFVVTATASEGGAIAGSAFAVLYEKNGPVSDTSMTITVPASS